MKKSMFVKLASVIAILAVFVTPVMFPIDFLGSVLALVFPTISWWEKMGT